MKQVVVQTWTETEMGWGQRPDGYTLHLTEADRLAFIKGYNDRLSKLYGDSTPDEYSYPDSDSFVGDIDDKLYNDLVTNKNDNDGNGMWGPGRNAPPRHEIKLTYEK